LAAGQADFTLWIALKKIKNPAKQFRDCTDYRFSQSAPILHLVDNLANIKRQRDWPNTHTSSK